MFPTFDSEDVESMRREELAHVERLTGKSRGETKTQLEAKDQGRFWTQS